MSWRGREQEREGSEREGKSLCFCMRLCFTEEGRESDDSKE